MAELWLPPIRKSMEIKKPKRRVCARAQLVGASGRAPAPEPVPTAGIRPQDQHLPSLRNPPRKVNRVRFYAAAGSNVVNTVTDSVASEISANIDTNGFTLKL